MERPEPDEHALAQPPSDPAEGHPGPAEDEVFVLDDFEVTAHAEASAEDGEIVLVEGQEDGAPLELQTAARAATVLPGTASSEDLEMVQLGAAAGEAAAVEPPVEALTEALEDLPAVQAPEGLPAPVNAAPGRPRWMWAAAAALVVSAAGASYFAWTQFARPEEVHTVAGGPRLPRATEAGSKPEAGAKAPNPVAIAYNRPEPTDPPGPEVPHATLTAAAVPDAPAEPLEGPSEDLAASDPGSDGVGEPAVAEIAPPEMSSGDAAPPNAGDAGVPEATLEAEPATAVAAFARGTEVLLRLRNGNFFHGKLDRYNAEEARLRVPNGVINFEARDVEAIVPMTQAPKKVGPQTVVELKNGNKLAGRLVEETQTYVTLAVGGSEITLARSAVLSVSLRSPLGLVLGEAESTPDRSHE